MHNFSKRSFNGSHSLLVMYETRLKVILNFNHHSIVKSKFPRNKTWWQFCHEFNNAIDISLHKTNLTSASYKIFGDLVA